MVSHRKVNYVLDVIEKTWVDYGDSCVLLCSGQDAVMVDLVMQTAPQTDIVFIDTGYHFKETLETIARIEQHYDKEIRKVKQAFKLEIADGFCCSDEKVKQLDEVLADKAAWFSGIRRSDNQFRSFIQVEEIDRRGLMKVNPLAFWSDDDVQSFIKMKNIIVNPLIMEGYLSVGCEPCTSKPVDSSNPRSGRWVNKEKTECGLHL